MGANVYITVEDITTQLLTYESIRLYRSGTLGGTYSLVTTIPLVAGTYHYSYEDSAGSPNAWYKYTLYNSVGPVESGYSNIFRPQGTTRLRIRQRALADYRAGLVMSAVSGCTTEKWKTADHRVASELFRAGRHVGAWVVPTVGSADLVGAARHVLTNPTPSSGELAVEAWGATPQAGDEAELHWLASPDEWNDAINRAMDRSWFLDTVPIVGVKDENEYSLAHLSWLRSRYNLHGVWYYPTGSSIQQPWAGDGRWYSVRDDRGIFTLTIHPSIDSSTTLYLECSRPMPPLYTDDAQPPPVCSEELAAALAYDEILSTLASPGSGSGQDRRAWVAARKRHAASLNKMLRDNRPRPRPVPPQPSTPPVAPDPFSAR